MSRTRIRCFVGQRAEEIRERCKDKTEFLSKEACVTRIQEVDDVVREESMKPRKQDEEEGSEK